MSVSYSVMPEGCVEEPTVKWSANRLAKRVMLSVIKMPNACSLSSIEESTPPTKPLSACETAGVVEAVVVAV